MSFRKPHFFLHKDKVALRIRTSFLPKVVSAFYLNEDIVLPLLCSAPVHPEEIFLNCLDVLRAIRVYLSAIASFKQTKSLFVVLEGSKRGSLTFKATVFKKI